MLIAEVLCRALGGERFALLSNEKQDSLVDVFWDPTNGEGFQIKEVMTGRRDDEVKAAQDEAERVESIWELDQTGIQRGFNRQETPWSDFLGEVGEILKRKLSKANYSLDRRRATDFLVYFNSAGQHLPRELTEAAV